MIVGVDWLLVFADQRETENFVGAIAEHLIGVHVVAGTSAGLKRINHPLVSQRAVQTFIGGLNNGIGQFGL